MKNYWLSMASQKVPSNTMSKEALNALWNDIMLDQALLYFGEDPDFYRFVEEEGDYEE